MNGQCLNCLAQAIAFVKHVECEETFGKMAKAMQTARGVQNINLLVAIFTIASRSNSNSGR